MIFLVFVLSSCSGQESTITIDKEEITQPISYLALGDSYTIGQGVAESERWPNQLSDTLRALDYEVEKLKIIATTGWTTTRALLQVLLGLALEKSIQETANVRHMVRRSTY